MKGYILNFFILLFILGGCAIQKPPVTHTVIEYRDSLVFKTDTVGVPIPVEVVKEITPTDTLKMETSLAKSVSYYDKDVKMLRGTLENKKGSIKTEIVYKERVIVRDTTITKEVPVEVAKIVKVTPWYSKILSAFGILFLIYIGVMVGTKIAKHNVPVA